MNFNVNVITPAHQIIDQVGRAVAAKIGTAMSRSTTGIHQEFRKLTRNLIIASSEYQSLTSGRLHGELGLKDPVGVMEKVIDMIANNTVVSYIPLVYRSGGGKFSGGLEFGIIRSGYADLYGIPGTAYTSFPSRESIPWLHWLLEKGDQIVVSGWEVSFNLGANQIQYSRSKRAIMEQGDGKSFSVPAAMAGVNQDNFLTRAFERPGVDARIHKIITREIERHL